MGLSEPQVRRTYSETRQGLLDKVPNVKVPLQLGPGVTDWVPLRDIAGSFIPETEMEAAISGLPMGKMFSALPGPAKRAIITALRKGENQARILGKRAANSPALGKAVEALGLSTGKYGGFDADLASGSRSLDNLYASVGQYGPTGLPPIDTAPGRTDVPNVVARIRAGMEAGMPVEESTRMASHSGFGGERNPAEVPRILADLLRTQFAPLRGATHLSGEMDISKIPEVLQSLSAPAELSPRVRVILEKILNVREQQ